MKKNVSIRAAVMRAALSAEQANKFALSKELAIDEAIKCGCRTNSEIAQHLSNQGIRTRMGHQMWSHQQVETIRTRLAHLKGK